MDANTITTERLAEVALFLAMAAESVQRLWRDATTGEVTTEEAAADLAEILSNINSIAK